MTIEEVRTRINEIEVMAKLKDNEQCHIMEDNLYVDVLKAIANDGRRDLAKEALKTRELKFKRWVS